MISVIIPAYIPTKRHHNYFLRSLKSLESQSHKDFEVICILNGCYTDYEAVLESMKCVPLDVKTFCLESKTSGAIARNFGIKNCNGSYVAQLDADDQYHPEKIERQIDFFFKNPEYDFVGTLAYDFENEGNIKNSCYLEGQYMTHDQIADAIERENVMCHSSVMFKRSSFEKLGGYNEKNKPGSVWPELGIRMWEDWDLWQRAVHAGMKLYNIPERLYYWSTGTSVER